MASVNVYIEKTGEVIRINEEMSEDHVLNCLEQIVADGLFENFISHSEYAWLTQDCSSVEINGQRCENGVGYYYLNPNISKARKTVDGRIIFNYNEDLHYVISGDSSIAQLDKRGYPVAKKLLLR